MSKTLNPPYPWIMSDGKPSKMTPGAAVLVDDSRVELSVDLARKLLAEIDFDIKVEDLPDGGVEITSLEPLLFGAGDTVEEAAKYVKQSFGIRCGSGFHNSGCSWEEEARILKLQIAWRDDEFEDVIMEALEKSRS